MLVKEVQKLDSFSLNLHLKHEEIENELDSDFNALQQNDLEIKLRLKNEEKNLKFLKIRKIQLTKLFLVLFLGSIW